MNNKKREDLKRAIDFFEELIWLIDSKRNLKLKEVPENLRALLDDKNPSIVSEKHKSSNPNIHFLIGVLPRLFKDKDLFPNNATITQFAKEILNIEVSRADKRSRYELIGLIICETDNLSDGKLNNLVDALSKITGNDESLNKLKENKGSNNFSWNDAIKKLTEIDNE